MNFSGGEPFIHKKGKFVGELVRYCKEDLQLPSVTIVSNGSLISEEWFQEYGTYSLHYSLPIIMYLTNHLWLCQLTHYG